MHTNTRKDYVPQNAQDVSAEIAAFSARGMNGRPTSVTDHMRRRLPAPDVSEFFVDGGLDGEGLKQALKQRDEEEAIESERSLRDAQANYERVLADHRRTVRELAKQNDAFPEQETDQPTDEDVDEMPAPVPVKGRLAQAIADASSAPASVALTQAKVEARDVLDEDIDHLWDWLRRDLQPNAYFFKSGFKSSRELFTYIGQALAQQVPIRAIYNQGLHVGFFALWPVSTVDRTALLHVYLSPDVRGHFSFYFPYVLTGAQKLVPPTVAIVMHADDHVDAFGRLLGGYGFVPHTMFIRPAVK